MPRTLPMHAHVLSLAAALWTAPALAQAPPDYDFQWSRVGAPGNPAFEDPTQVGLTPVVGRGSVPYEFRMSTLEVTTSQWIEFLNAFSGVSSPHPFWYKFPPTFSGAMRDTFPAYHYALRTDVPNAGMLPVGGITWRMGALYCNWLTNGKGSNPSSLLTGAYDTSTWGNLSQPGNPYTDGLTHLSTAKFWIPTLDEQLKADHYDPNRYGPGQGGWWKNKNKSDVFGTPGLPGVGTTSAGLMDPSNPDPNFAWRIPLGAYPQSQSPWGLLDTSGGAAEWDEEPFNLPNPSDRGWFGASAGDPATQLDSIFGIGSEIPSFQYSWIGLRIASTVPSPSGLVSISILSPFALRRRRS